jgi:hypothetical protein
MKVSGGAEGESENQVPASLYCLLQYNLLLYGKLLDVLDAWYLDLQKSRSAERATTLSRVDRLLDLPSAGNTTIRASFRTMYWVSNGLSEPLTLSIHVLLGTLAFARDAAFPEEAPHIAAWGYRA